MTGTSSNGHFPASWNSVMDRAETDRPRLLHEALLGPMLMMGLREASTGGPMIRLKAGNKELEVRNVTWLEILAAIAILAVVGGIIRTLSR